jgi:hypothetical protein
MLDAWFTKRQWGRLYPSASVAPETNLIPPNYTYSPIIICHLDTDIIDKRATTILDMGMKRDTDMLTKQEQETGLYT